MKVNWELYLNKQDGETLENTPLNRLRKRRHDSLGGTKTTKTEKKALLKREADRIKNAAKNIAHGQAMDASIFAEQAALTEHSFANYKGEASTYRPVEYSGELGRVIYLVNNGTELLRAIAWGKRPHDEVTEDGDMEADQELPFEQQQFYLFYVGAMVSDLISIAKCTRLTPDLTNFLIRVVESYLNWSDTSDFRLQNINDLKRLKSGEDLYRPPLEATVAPVQQPPPQTPKNYQTAEDVLVAPTPPTMQKLAIKSFLENRSWVEGEEIT